MDLVPLLHVRDTAVVTGPPDAWIPLARPWPGNAPDAIALARHLFARFASVGIVDLGEGRTLDVHHAILQKLARQHVALWVDGFPETVEDIMDLFVDGAERVIARVDRIDGPELLDVLDLADGEVWAAYAYKGAPALRALLAKAPPRGLLDAGAAGIVLIDLVRAGTKGGFDRAALTLTAGLDAPVYVTGGIASPAEVDELSAAGVAGAFVGTALLSAIEPFATWAEGHKQTAAAKEQPEAEAHIDVPQRRGPVPGLLPTRPGAPRLSRGPEHDD